MLETGAHEIGCPVVPAGVGNTEQQVRSIADIRPAGYVGTPSFLKIILDKGAEMGADLSSLRRALVSGEALPGALRTELSGRGLTVRQCYATADLGLIAYESVPDAGLILDEWVIVEILRPGTGDPVAPGEVGEVVVTTLNPDYPLIRFATGDLSTMLPGTSPCGRTAPRLKGRPRCAGCSCIPRRSRRSRGAIRRSVATGWWSVATAATTGWSFAPRWRRRRAARIWPRTSPGRYRR
jgi:phenylacetate-CoA ligase